jgi:hypothetical protein
METDVYRVEKSFFAPKEVPVIRGFVSCTLMLH